LSGQIIHIGEPVTGPPFPAFAAVFEDSVIR